MNSSGTYAQSNYCLGSSLVVLNSLTCKIPTSELTSTFGLSFQDTISITVKAYNIWGWSSSSLPNQANLVS